MSTGIGRSAELSLADVASDTVAALWVTIYTSLNDAEVGRSLLVCKTFKDLLSPLISAVKYSSPNLNQQSFDRLCKTFSQLQKLHIRQKYDDDLDILDWSSVSHIYITYHFLAAL